MATGGIKPRGQLEGAGRSEHTNQCNSFTNSGFQACRRLARKTFQATGMAVPRPTTLKDSTVSRSNRLVASSAKASGRQGQPPRIQATKGAKQVVTSSSRRSRPDGWAADLDQSRSRSRTVFQAWSTKGLKAVATALRAQEPAKTLQKL
jgi:hypothetical protein